MHILYRAKYRYHYGTYIRHVQTSIVSEHVDLYNAVKALKEIDGTDKFYYYISNRKPVQRRAK